MTKEEIKSRFEKGETLTCFFGIRNRTFTIGKIKCSEKQYNSIVNEYRGKYRTHHEFGGFTKHNYTIK